MVSLPLVGEHCHRAVVFIADGLAAWRAHKKVAGLPSQRCCRLNIGGRSESADVTIIVQPATLQIIWYVAPNQKTGQRCSRLALGPQAACEESLDRCVADFDLPKALIDDHDVRIRISLWGGLRSIVSFLGCPVVAMVASHSAAINERRLIAECSGLASVGFIGSSR